MNEKLVPISKIAPDVLSVNLPLPSYVDQNRIGVNVDRIEALCRLAGIRWLSVYSVDGGEASSFTPLIAGHDGSGSAYAAKTGTATQIRPFETRQVSVEDKSGDLPRELTRTDGDIMINVDEVVNRIQTEKWEHGIRSTVAWTRYIDEVVRKGIIEIGTKHLTSGLNNIDYGFMVGAISNIATVEGLIALNFGTEGALLAGIPVFLLSSAFQSFLKLTGAKALGKQDEFRPSLIPGPQYDRAAILKFKARKALVGEIK